MTNKNLTGLALCGMLLVVTAAIIAASSLLWPVTIRVFAQTMISGANETAALFGPAPDDRCLFIQGAESGSISEVNATTSTLELNDVSDKIIMFSFPEREVSSEDTTNFIGNWSVGPNKPPYVTNAVLFLDDDEQRQELAVIGLYNPKYDPQANTVRYDITAENATSIGLPNEFGQSTLVIDRRH